MGEKPTIKNPFTAESYALANEIEQSSREVLSFYNKLASCGVDCERAKAQAQIHLDFVHALKREFGDKPQG